MIINLARRVAHRLALGGGLIILASAFVIATDVVLRQVFRAPIGGVEEHAGYGLAIASAWGLAEAFLRRTHIRIDVLYRLLPVALRTVLDVTAMLVLLALSSYLGWLAVNVWLLSVEFNARSAPPLFLPLTIIQGMWVAGILVFIAVMAVVALAVGRTLARGNAAAVRSLIGPAAVQEELEEEIAKLERRRAGES